MHSDESKFGRRYVHEPFTFKYCSVFLRGTTLASYISRIQFSSCIFSINFNCPVTRIVNILTNN